MESAIDYPHLVSLALVVALTTWIVGWRADQRRDPHPAPAPFWAIPVGLVFMLVYCFAAYLLPAAVVTAFVHWVLHVPLKLDPDVAVSETIVQLATLFAVGGNYADMAGTYGRTRFGTHLRAYFAVVIPAYFATMAVAWVGAQLLASTGNFDAHRIARAGRLFALPMLAPASPGLNLLLVGVLLLASACVSYLLRKRSENRGGVTILQFDERSAPGFVTLRELVQETRRRRELDSDDEAFLHLFLQRVLRLSDKQIDACVTYGPNDGGIAALHVDAGVHVVGCEYADNVPASRYPYPKYRLDRLAETWTAIASGRDGTLRLNAALQRQITAWRRDASVPRQIHIVTNREQSGIDRAAFEKKMNASGPQVYHYYEQGTLLAALSQDDGA